METINYVVLTTGRNGSTLLCKLLNLNGIFKGDNDFNCETFHKKEDRINIKEETPQEYSNRILEKYKIAYKGAEIRGLKIIFSQFNNLVKNIRSDSRYTQFRYEDIAKSFPRNTKYIVVKRKDIKKQAISYLKAIKGFGWEYEEKPAVSMMIYHPAEIDSIIGQIIHDNKMLGSFIKKNNIEPLYITYEGLCTSFEETIKEVFKFLDIPIPGSINIKTDYRKQYDKLNDEVLGEYEFYRKIKRIRKRNMMLFPFIKKN